MNKFTYLSRESVCLTQGVQITDAACTVFVYIYISCNHSILHVSTWFTIIHVNWKQNVITARNVRSKGSKINPFGKLKKHLSIVF